MNELDGGGRNSVALSADLITDPQARAEREARNGLLQFDLGMRIVEDWIVKGPSNFKLRPSLILSLHRAALDGISLYAGNWRPAGVTIEGSQHEPVGAHLVAELVEEMCDYINEKWSESALHLSAYLMWRLNWIHPFADGNGRTSRILSYTVLSIRLGSRLPGTPTIPEQIVDNRDPYFHALDSADSACKAGHVDVSDMEKMLEAMLAKQLMSVIESAGAKRF
jgi:fido (protein-threonine AMPylation protein)